MNRRNTVFALIALGAAPFTAFGQQAARPARIGVLATGDSVTSAWAIEAIQKGLRELGYVEGKNVVLEPRFADGKTERLTALAAELVELKVDVIVALSAHGIQAAQRATTTIPIVMAASLDPVDSGFVKSLARPGGNITGLSAVIVDVSPKYLDMLLSMKPALSRVAVLLNPTNPATPAILANLQATAQRAGIILLPLETQTARDIENAFITMTKLKVGAVILPTDPLFNQQRAKVVKLAAQNRLPTMFGMSNAVDAGGLMSYGANYADQYRYSVTYVDKILKGAKPADLPVEQPTKFELVVNLKTAKALGIKIPQSILLRADRVIE